MAAPQLTLYFDTVSPFAYLAFHVVRTSSVFKPCQITYTPVLLGGIMKACGNTPPLYIKNKDKWIAAERLRWSRLFNVPMAEKIPTGFPVPTVAVQRAVTAVTLLAPERLVEVVAAIYHGFFVLDQPVSKVDDFRATLEEVLGKDMAGKVIEKSTSDEVKKLLTANTEKAMADGAFGLPYFVATSREGKTETFWGFDHIGQVTDHLGLEKPKPGNGKEGGWKAML